LTDSFSLEARYYDKIWGSDQARYEAETQFLYRTLRKYGVVRVLDLACGTGGHYLGLTKLGYDVVGLDVSETMLKEARKKLSESGVQSCFVLGEMTKAQSSLLGAKIALPFDAVVCMGSALAHMLDDKMLSETLNEVRKVLKEGGVFIFCINNAQQLRDDLTRQLRLDTIVNEPDLQLAILCYNFRDSSNPDILIWNSLWFINEHGKIDFQVRTHPLRWFRYDNLKTTLESHGYIIVQTYGDTLGREEFDNNKHDTIFMICQKLKA
jgi:SAM-dependent methyltransferase